jgi:hypothetical protein
MKNNGGPDRFLIRSGNPQAEKALSNAAGMMAVAIRT